MLLITRQIFTAAVATATATLASVETQLDSCISHIFTIETTGFSGTIDFQGREHNNDTWTNVAYQEIDIDGTRAGVNDQLSYTTETARKRYLVPISPSHLQVVMTRTAGSLDVFVRGSGVALELPMSHKLVSLGDEQLTVPVTAVNLTVPAGARRAKIEVHTASMYYTEDSVTPSSSNGGRLDSGDVMHYLDADYSGLLSNLEFIRQSADGLVIAHYYD